MKVRLSIIAGIAALASGAAHAQSSQPPPQFVAREAPNRLDWAAIFPVTPAFADWTAVGQVLNQNGTVTGELWLHRDSLRPNRAGSIPIIEADLLVNFNGQDGVAPGYVRFLQIISCGNPTISIVKALGRVTVSGGVIRPASDLTRDPKANYDFGFARAICFDRGFQSRFLARN